MADLEDVILDYAPIAVRTGYTLEGWAYDEAGTLPVGALDAAEISVTLYAVWAII